MTFRIPDPLQGREVGPTTAVLAGDRGEDG
jgi:hypothetical protein